GYRRPGESDRPCRLRRVRRRDGCRSPTGVVGTGLVPQRQLSPDDGGEQPAGPSAAADDAGAADSGQPGAGRLGAARVGDEPPARQPRSKVDAGGGRRRSGVAGCGWLCRLASARRREAGGRLDPLSAKLSTDFLVHPKLMSQWIAPAARWGALVLVLLA